MHYSNALKQYFKINLKTFINSVSCRYSFDASLLFKTVFTKIIMSGFPDRFFVCLIVWEFNHKGGKLGRAFLSLMSYRTSIEA